MANLRDKLREQPPEKPARAGSKGTVKKKRPAKKEAPKSLLGGMDVNRKLLFAALGIAVVAGFLAVTYLSDLEDSIGGKAEKVSVFVPTEDLPARKQITESMIEARKFPKGLLPEGAITDQKELIGKITLAPVVKGEVLHKKRIGEASAETGVAPKLQPNERGFLYVPEGASDIALVKPDDYVDLTATIQTDHGYLSTKIAQRVRVLSVGNRFNNAPTENTGEAGAYGDLLTLAVPSNKVALLAALKEQGNLSLSLREQGDTSVTPPEIPEADLVRYVMGRIPQPQAPRPVQPKVIVKERPVIVHDRPKPQPPRPQPVQPKPGIEVYSGTTLIHKK
ncbi:MAG TPA: Flp pilus assembly protein CpaB [Stenomitos sp.]